MFSVGMYVSCPILKSKDTIHVLGKIKKYDETTDEMKVVFFDREDKNRFLDVLEGKYKTYFGHEVKRASIKTPSSALWHNQIVKIICELSGNKNALKTYCCHYHENNTNHIVRIDESALEIDFYQLKISAEREAVNYLNSDFTTFTTRQFLSNRKHYLESIDNILSTLVNTRVNLYSHQIDAILKATKEGQTRVMLADEVGLGKTIEALTILKYYKQVNKIFRCLIVVPSSLEYQWFNEINERFEIEAEIFSYKQVIYKKTSASTFIISYGDFFRYRYELDEMQWDMLMIDEAHKILKSPYYPALMKASRKIRNVILLSATPITHNDKVYLQLMKMLNPVRYGNITIEQFAKLTQIQGFLIDKLFDMNTDLEFYDQMEMSESFVLNLQEINEELSDPYLNKIITRISPESSDEGLYAIKLAMEYLRKKYIIEADVVRHRRIDIQEAQIKRILKSAEPYDMEGADLGIFESTLYDALLSLIENKINNDNKYQWIKLLEAMHSSPYALWNEYCKIELSVAEKWKCFDLLKKWKDYCDNEIMHIIKGDLNRRTRFGRLIDVIESCKENKILIFSDFSETVKKIYSMIHALYGEECVTMFVSEMTRLETQLAARKFQNDEKCRFIICDKSGGEGRNFQNADLIIHFDMSWSPAMMEQRIGRLDRIGRDVERDVESIVIYATETIEENIFNLYNDSLKVFSRSLCGLEIIFEELQEMIADAFAKDTMFGLSHAQKEIELLVSQMEDSVEREIYFSNSNENNTKEQMYIREVTEAFERENETEAESRITTLFKNAGIKSNINVNTGTVDIYFNKPVKRKIKKNLFYEAKDLGNYNGTFRREYAVKHDSVEYFSTNHVLYQTAMDLVDQVQQGRFLAISIADERIRWAGFVFVWNVEFNQECLFRGRINPQRHQYIKKYLNEQQVRNTFKIFGEDDFNESEIASIIEDERLRTLDSLEDTTGYGILYDEDSWEIFLKNSLNKAEVDAKKLVHSWLKKSELQDYLCRERIVKDIDKKTVCYQDKKRLENERTIISALMSCILQIDSIMYIEI